jgi:hypothetical protein
VVTHRLFPTMVIAVVLACVSPGLTIVATFRMKPLKLSNP